ARAIYGPWCGGSAWRFLDGRVADPRLDVCSNRRGHAVVAFAWINPAQRAKWIVVDQPGYREVWPAAGHLPVRVSTVSGINHRAAVFKTAQYDSRGVLLSRRTVTPAIAS